MYEAGRGDQGFDHPVALGRLATGAGPVDGHLGLAVVDDRVEDGLDVGHAQSRFDQPHIGHHLENFGGREKRSVLDHQWTSLNFN